MAWVPSHADLGQHPKMKRAARIAGVSEPAIIGHLHLLWWFALSIAPDGDLSRFDADDLAIAVQFDGDPELFVKALRECGPSGSVGFITDDMRLHDWDDYGGKYIRKVEAGRDSANKRWKRRGDADKQSLPPSVVAEQIATQCEPNGLLMGTQWVPNTEESRVEKKDLSDTPKTAVKERPRNDLWDAVIEACGWHGQLTKSQQGRTAAAVKELRDIGATPDQVKQRTIIYRLKYPKVDVTPNALAANWASLATPPPGVYLDAGRGGVFFDD
jgi:hypothetical protein